MGILPVFFIISLLSIPSSFSRLSNFSSLSPGSILWSDGWLYWNTPQISVNAAWGFSVYFYPEHNILRGRPKNNEAKKLPVIVSVTEGQSFRSSNLSEGVVESFSLQRIVIYIWLVYENTQHTSPDIFLLLSYRTKSKSQSPKDVIYW